MADGERYMMLAFEQVFPEKQLKESKPDLNMWVMAENPKLPTVVREELLRAFRIHMVTGRMDVLRLGALVQTIWYSYYADWFISWYLLYLCDLSCINRMKDA